MIQQPVLSSGPDSRVPLRKPASPLYPRVSVLLITADETLGETRSMILRAAGCSVALATQEQAPQIAAITPFQVAVICQAIQSGRAQALARELRRSSPGIRIIRIALCSDGTESGFDRVLNAPVDPALLKHSIMDKC